MRSKYFLTVLLLLNVFFPIAAQTWSESFESYPTGFFPSAWIRDGNANDTTANHVTTTAFSGGEKSLRLYGTIGGCWAAIAYHPLIVTAPFELEVAVRNGNESLSGCNPDRAIIHLRQGLSWTNPARTLIHFKGNGNINSAAGNILQTYTSLTWYVVRVRYERLSPTQVRISYWINGVYKGVETLAADAQEDQMTNLELSALEGTVWFDDVKINTVGLVAYYPFDGNSNDASGNGHHGRLVGGTFISDRFGNSTSALRFNGVSDKVVVPPLTFTNQISIVFWTVLRSDAPYFFPYHIIEQDTAWVFSQRLKRIYGFFVKSNGNYGIIESQDLSYDTFHHFCVTFDGDSTKMYVDGTLVGNTYFAGAIATSTDSIHIGAYTYGSDYNFNGDLDDIRIYNRTLRASEVDSLYRLGGLTDVSDLEDAIPTEFAIQQNYPNPFNPTTTFAFRLPRPSKIYLTIFNTLGQQIATLVDDDLSTGSHRITWNATVASGIYLYRFEAVAISDPGMRFLEVKKMLLLK